jgi:hypothetical protein
VGHVRRQHRTDDTGRGTQDLDGPGARDRDRAARRARFRARLRAGAARPMFAVPVLIVTIASPWAVSGVTDAASSEPRRLVAERAPTAELAADAVDIAPALRLTKDGGSSGSRPAGPRYGIDVSWPQCASPLPQVAIDYVVVGLTDGRAVSVNPCLAEQVTWAAEQHAALSLYVVPNSPSDQTMRQAARRPECAADETECPAYTSGVIQAEHALRAAEIADARARTWWLDVEESASGTLWGDDLDANAAVLRGWVATLVQARHHVGIYSTAGYWEMITGGLSTTLPEWVAVGEAGMDTAREACATPFSVGPVLMTQWLTGPLDGDLVCPDAGDLVGEMLGPWQLTRTAGVPPLLTIPVPHPHPVTVDEATRRAGEHRGHHAGRHGARGRRTGTTERADPARLTEPRPPTGKDSSPQPAPAPKPSKQPTPAPTKPTPTPKPAATSPTKPPSPAPPTPTPAPTPTPTTSVPPVPEPSATDAP